MPPSSSRPAEAELKRRREDIRRSLSRVNTAGVAVVLVTLALAAAAAFGALRAGRQSHLASEANERGREELWKSYLAQARAGRLSRVSGSKETGLKAIAAAAEIRPSVELRNEAIAHLAMFDFEPTGVSWTNHPGRGHSAVDPKLEMFLESDHAGSVRLREIAEPTNAFVLRATNGPVYLISFSPDGRFLALTHANRLCVVWDLATRSKAYHVDDAIWARFNGTSDQLLVIKRDRGAAVCDATSGRELGAIKLNGRAVSGAFVGNDQVALAVKSELQIWNWRTGRQIEKYETDLDIWSVASSGHLVATSEGSGEVRIWNRATRRSRRLQAHQSSVNHIFFSPAGDQLVSTSYDGSTKVWDARTGQMLLTTSRGFAVQFSADGQRMVFNAQSGWSIWRVSAPSGLATLDCSSGSSLNVWHADFSPDERWLAATKEDGVCFFEVQSGKRIFFQPMNRSRTAYFLAGGTNLLSTSTHRIAFWPIVSAETNRGDRGFRLAERELIPLTNITYLESGVLSFDQRHLVLPISRTEAAVYDLEKRLEILRLTNASLPKLSSISPDGRWIATGTFHGRGMMAWDSISGRMLHDFNDGNTSAHFSPNGRWLVSAGSSHYRIYEPGTWKLLHHFPRESGSDLPNLAAFDANGSKMAAIKQLDRIELLETHSWRAFASLIPPDPQVITWIVFSRTGRYLACATAQDLLQVWDLEAIQRSLATLNLGWGLADSHVVERGVVTDRLQVGLNWLSNWIAPLAVGVLVVLVCAVYIRHRQRRLLAAYNEVDEIVEEQTRQLSVAQTELVHSQKMKALGTLAAGIAHDFNNLLSVIRMSNQLTQAAAPGNSEIQENTAEVEQAVEQGRKLVRSMLGYSRETKEESGPFPLPELVEDTVALLSKQFLGGIALTLELDHKAWPVEVSRNRLEQILLNLIVNASEAMQGRGSLQINVRNTSELPESAVLRPRSSTAYVELIVADSGQGISAEVLPRIFEPFFTTKHRGVVRGTGLGLSMVYAAAEQEGLGLGVETAEGQGARFRLIIPAVTVRESHTVQTGGAS